MEEWNYTKYLKVTVKALVSKIKVRIIIPFSIAFKPLIRYILQFKQFQSLLCSLPVTGVLNIISTGINLSPLNINKVLALI